MKFGARTDERSGFTLAEVLAALLFMGIVIPVAVEALHIAAFAGVVAERKGEAARVAQRLLDETIVTTNYMAGFQSGSITEGQHQFRYSLRSEPWTQDPMQNAVYQLTVEVKFAAQDRDYSVRMSTLVNTTLQ